MLVLVTGASKGVGLEMVKKFSQDKSCLVIAVSRNIKPVLEFARKHAKTNVLAFRADITSAADQTSIFRTVKKLKIRLNILINNAGELVNKPFTKITSKELHAVYETNVLAPFMLAQKLLPLFDNKTKSHIVNISSMGGFQGSVKFAGLSAYSSSKAALACLSECLAEELKEKNLAVNCLALGAVQTEMLSKAFPGYKAPLTAKQMAEYICEFSINGQKYFNGKIIPLSLSTP
jgi:3-oxoacyl-[acyl-carrier protein] reductase